MNKVFKVIWSEARNAYVVVSEIAKNHGSKSCSTKKLLTMLIATGVMTCASMAPAMAAPNVDASATVNVGKKAAVDVAENAKVNVEEGSNVSVDKNVTIGKGAVSSPYVGQTGNVAIGEKALAWNGNGLQEALMDFGQGGAKVKSFFGIPYGADIVDGTKLPGSIAIGKNTVARSGSTMIGDHGYTGKIGDTTITPDGNGIMKYNNDVYSTTIGANSFNSGALASVTGVFSIASSKYDGENYRFHAVQNTGATIYGSMNSIESATSDAKYSGIASSVLGFANKTQNANAALIWGTGNEVTNSIESIDIDYNGWNKLSVAEAQQKAIEAMQSSKYAGGSVMAIGGGNKADYAKYSQLTGVQNKVTGTEAKTAKYDFVNGYQNTVTNASDVTVIGIKNEVTADGNKVIGDNHKVSGRDNVIFGSADKVTETTVNNAVVLGHNAKVTGEGAVALGSGSVADRANAVSVGRKDANRQIINVAAGTEDTDAVNVSQLRDATANANKGWKLSTEGGAANQVASEATVDFSGKKDAGDHQNITVSNDGNNVKIDLASELHNVTGVVNGDSRVALGTGVAGITNGQASVVMLNGSTQINGVVGIDNTGKISGVANGEADKDAVNYGQLKDVKAEAEKHSVVTDGANITVTPEKATDGHMQYKVALKNDITLEEDDPDAFVSISGSKGTIWTSGSVTAGSVAVGTAKADGTTPFFVDSNGAFYAADGKFSVDKDGNANANSIQTNALNSKYNLSVGTANVNGTMPFFVNSNGAFYAANGKLVVDKDGKVTATEGEIGNVVLKNGVLYKNTALRDGELYVGDADGNYSQITPKSAKLGQVTIDEKGNMAGVNSIQTNALNAKYNLSVGTANENGTVPFFVNSNGAFYAANGKLVVDKDGKVTATEGEIGNVVLKNGVLYKNTALRDGELYVGDASGNYSQITTKGAKLGKVTVAADGKISGVAAGAVTADSTDAVNGSQLHAVATEAGKHSKVVNGNNTNVEETTVDGQKVYKVNLNNNIMVGDVTGKYVSISGTNGTIEATGAIATKDRVYADKGAKLADIDVTDDKISNGASSIVLDGSNVKVNDKVTFDQNGNIAGVNSIQTNALNAKYNLSVGTANENGIMPFFVNSNGAFYGANNNFSVDKDGKVTATAGEIGNVVLQNGVYTGHSALRDAELFVGDADGNYSQITPKSAKLGQVTIDEKGNMAGVNSIQTNALNAKYNLSVGTANENGIMPFFVNSNGAFYGANNNFSVDKDGKVTATAGEIGNVVLDNGVFTGHSALRDGELFVGDASGNYSQITTKGAKLGKVTVAEDGKISGVAAGAVTADSTDAVNGSQLHAVATEAGKHSKVVSGNNINVEETDVDGQKFYKVNMNKDIMLGDLTGKNVSISGTNGTIEATGAIATKDRVYADNGAKLADIDVTGDTISNGDAKLALNGAAGTAGMINGKGASVYMQDGYTVINSKVAFDQNGKISGVAAGAVTADSTDAVNGSQLHAVATEAGKHSKVVSGNNINVEETDVDGQKFYKVNMNKDIMLGDLTGKNVSISGTNGTIEATGAIATKDRVYADNGAKLADIDVTGNKISNGASSIVLDGSNVKVNDKVTIDQDGKISGVAAGEISSTSTDAINGSQLKETNDRVAANETAIKNNTEAISKLDGRVTANETAIKNNADAIGNLNTRVDGVEKLAKQHTTVAAAGDNITVTEDTNKDGGKEYKVALDKDINLDSVTTGQTVMNNDGLKVGKDVSVTATAVTAGQTSISNDGLKVNGKTYVSDSGLNANDQKITKVADGDISETSKDAVNGSQLYKTNQEVANNATNISSLSHSISNLDNRVNKVGAGAAALAALHPLDFDPDAKWDFAAGYGNYRGANAAAVGAYYRPNEDTMFSVGGTFGNGENMVNAGVSFKLGSGSSHVSTSRVAMAKEIKELRGELEAMKSAMLDANAGKKIDTSKLQLFPDVPQNHWAYEYVAQLAGNGMIEGYPDGNFAGDRPMTRYEFAAILYRAMTKGAVLSDKILSEFSHELEYFTVDTIAKDKAGNPTIQRVRTVKENKNK